MREFAANSTEHGFRTFMRNRTVTHPMARIIEHEVEYPHPPEKVWRALTEPAQIARWFPAAWGRTTTDFQPVVGATFRMDAEKKRGWRGSVTGKVLEVVPQRRLVYTWAGSPQEDIEPTRVEWTLESTPNGTRLRFIYTLSPQFTGLTGWMAEKGAGASWRKMMNASIPDILGATTAAVQ